MGGKQKFGVARAGDPIENDAGNGQSRIEFTKSLDQGRHTARLPLGIDDQNDRSTQELGNGSRTPCLTSSISTIKEPHHPFDHRHLSTDTAQSKAALHTVFAAHPGIEITGEPAAGGSMMAGVDEIRSNLEGRHLQTTAAQGRKEGEGDSGLATPRSRGSDDESLHGSAVQELYNGIAVGVVIDDIETAVALLNGKETGQRGADGVEEDDAIGAAMGDKEHLFAAMGGDNAGDHRPDAIRQIVETLPLRHPIVDDISKARLPLLRIKPLQFRPTLPFPIADIELAQPHIALNLEIMIGSQKTGAVQTAA